MSSTTPATKAKAPSRATVPSALDALADELSAVMTPPIPAIARNSTAASRDASPYLI